MSRAKLIIILIALVSIGLAFFLTRGGGKEEATAGSTKIAILADAALAQTLKTGAVKDRLADLGYEAEVTVLEDTDRIDHELRFGSYDVIWLLDEDANQTVSTDSEPLAMIDSIYTLDTVMVDSAALADLTTALDVSQASGAKHYVAAEDVFNSLNKTTEQRTISEDVSGTALYRAADYKTRTRLNVFTKSGQKLATLIADDAQLKRALAVDGWRGADKTAFNQTVNDSQQRFQTE